jgi:hypothetical protein
MMDPQPPLIDQLYALSFGKPVPAWQSNRRMRQALTEARRFVLTADMASFLADITCAACNKRTETILFKAVHQMRTAARLPHAVTWVEYDLLKYMAREDALIAATYSDSRFTHVQEGWLLNGFQQDDQEFRLQLFHRTITADGAVDFKTLMFAPHWRTDDGRPHSNITFTGEDDRTGNWPLAVMLGSPDGPRAVSQATVGMSELLRTLVEKTAVDSREQLGFANAVLRRLWAFLATVNDIPVLTKTVRTAKGFIAKARHHPFLEHRVISLHVPQRTDHHKLARSIVAIAKRRAHMVRGHWRKDWRHPLSPLCEHDFETVDGTLRCKLCQGQRLFIQEHQRGDVSLGLVTHDYSITHKEVPSETRH